jgi:hypothetical protein
MSEISGISEIPEIPENNTYLTSSNHLEKFLALAKEAGCPQLSITNLDRLWGAEGSWIPSAGQVWRANAGEIAMLVLILSSRESSFLACPVSVEPTGEDELSAVSTELVGRLSLSMPLTIWAGIPRWIPRKCLSRPIENLGIALPQWALGLRDLPEGYRRGLPATLFSRDADVRAWLTDEIDGLVATAI